MPPAPAGTSVAVEVHRGVVDTVANPMVDTAMDTAAGSTVGTGAEAAVDTVVMDSSDRFEAVKPGQQALVHLVARRPAARRTLAIPADGHVFAPYIIPPS